MSTTKVGVVIDALIAACRTAGLTVVDGPPTQRVNVGQDVLYVGWQGTEGSEAARTNQTWAGLGNRARNEDGNILCFAEAMRGDTVMKPTRDAALAVVAGVEAILRTDPQLAALTGPDVVSFGGVDSHVPLQDDNGSRWGVLFHLDLFARL